MPASPKFAAPALVAALVLAAVCGVAVASFVPALRRPSPVPAPQPVPEVAAELPGGRGEVCEQITTVASCPDKVVSVSAYPVPRAGEKVQFTYTDPRDADRRSTLLERERFMNEFYAKNNCVRVAEAGAFQEPVSATTVLRASGALERWQFGAAFPDGGAREFFGALAKAAPDVIVDQVCRAAGGVVAVVYDEQYHASFWVMAKDSSRVVAQRFAGRTIDGAYQLYPNFVGTKALLRTAYGDAGNVWWEYYLHDFATGKDEKVESCSGGYREEEELKDGKIQFTYTYSCDQVYVPAS